MSMSLERIALKTRLMNERVVTLGWHGPKTGKWVSWTGLCCELCGKRYKQGYTGKEFVPGLDLHEAIISRGNVRGVERLTKAVTESEYNCVLLCNHCNVRVAEAKWATDILTARLIMRYGADAIIQWIESLGMKVPGPYILQVERVRDEMGNLPYDWKERRVDKYARQKEQEGRLPV